MSNQTTIVGAQTRISGNLQGEQDLRVSGRIDGTIELTGTLFVEPEGVVVADIHADRALISGTVVGNITVTDVIEIAPTGRVVGDLVAPRVVIADGAAFRGGIDMGDLDAPRAAAPAPRKVDRAETAKVATAAALRPSEPPRPRPEPPRRPPRPQPLKPPAPPVERPALKPVPAPAAPAAPGEDPAAKRRPKPPTTAGKKTRVRRK